MSMRWKLKLINPIMLVQTINKIDILCFLLALDIVLIKYHANFYV